MTLTRFTNLYPSVVGFDGLFDRLDNLMNEKVSTFPPHNIVKLSDSKYHVEMAVAGFAEDELTIETLRNVLSIKGEKKNEESKEYLHQGIATRSFTKNFTVADTVRVTGASMNNGILSIELENIVPEEKQVRKIQINKKELVPELLTE